MTTERYIAEPTAQDWGYWSWHVVDRQSGEKVDDAQGLGEKRAKRIADLMNRAERTGGVPAFDGVVNWAKDEQGRMIAYVECDRPSDRSAPRLAGWVAINGKAYECLDVLAGARGDPRWPIRPGEPIGLVLRTAYPCPGGAASGLARSSAERNGRAGD